MNGGSIFRMTVKPPYLGTHESRKERLEAVFSGRSCQAINRQVAFTIACPPSEIDTAPPARSATRHVLESDRASRNHRYT
jgi:hypothetical protein